MPPKWFRQPQRRDRAREARWPAEAPEDSDEEERARLGPPLMPLRFPQAVGNIPRGYVRNPNNGKLVTGKCWMFSVRLTVIPGHVNSIYFNNISQLLRESYVLPSVAELNNNNNGARIDYLVYQLELGENSRLGDHHFHYQGYMEFDQKVSYVLIMNMFGWDAIDERGNSVWRGDDIYLALRNWDQERCIRYCTKDETCVWQEGVVDGAPTWRVVSGMPHAPDAASVGVVIRNRIVEGAGFDDLAREYPDIVLRMANSIGKMITEYRKSIPQKLRQVKVFARWGDTGTGKTHYVFAVEGLKRVYRKNTDEIYFEGYNSNDQAVLLLDEFVANTPGSKHVNNIKDFLTWLDVFPLWIPQKYGGTWAMWETVYITSNQPPSQWFPYISEEHRDALYRRLQTGGITKLVNASNRKCMAKHHEQLNNPMVDPRDLEHIEFVTTRVEEIVD